MKPDRKIRLTDYLGGSESRQFFRFVVSGLVNTVVGFIVYASAILIISFPFWAANFLALLGGMCTGYFLSRHFVFASANPPGKHSAKKYFGLHSVQYILGTAMIGALIYFGLGEIVSYVLVLPFVVAASYLVQRQWIFTK